jgi:signal transduction histidine kinase
LSFSIAPDAPATFAGASLLVRQALENLVTNAIKFSPRGTMVALTARSEGVSIRFDVRDEGPGIAPGDQTRLFERFHRDQQAITRRAPGLGLGLSIVKRVARAHGGTVGLASQEGHGSTFWVTFPVENWRPAAP